MMLVAEGATHSPKMMLPLTSSSFGRMTQGIVHFFGTRYGPQYGGVNGEQGTVKAGDPGYPLVVSVSQVHGTDVLSIDRPLKVGERFFDGYDAILTNQPETLLTIQTADCVPVLLVDSPRGVVGVVHAGWRGAVHGIVAKSVQKMAERFGADLASLHVAIGPSAGPCCYEVDTPVLEQLAPDLPNASTILKRTSPRTGQLDLKELIRWQAVSLGIAEDHLHTVDICTMCRSDLFFSYRREGTVHGSMVSGIMLRSARFRGSCFQGRTVE